MMATVGRTYGASSGSPVGGGGLLAVLAGGYVTFRLGTGPPATAGSYSAADASSLAAFLTLAALASTSAAISAASSAAAAVASSSTSAGAAEPLPSVAPERISAIWASAWDR